MTRFVWTNRLVREALSLPETGEPGRQYSGVCTDSRRLRRGELFVALKDERDGHDFVPAAFAKGAAAALVSESYARKDGDEVLIRVNDVLRALELIGMAARARLSSGSHSRGS